MTTAEKIIARRKSLARHAPVDRGCLELQYSVTLDVFVIRWNSISPVQSELIAAYDGDDSARAVADFETLAR